MKEQKLVEARCIGKNWRQEYKGSLVSRARLVLRNESGKPPQRLSPERR